MLRAKPYIRIISKADGTVKILAGCKDYQLQEGEREIEEVCSVSIDIRPNEAVSAEIVVLPSEINIDTEEKRLKFYLHSSFCGELKEVVSIRYADGTVWPK